MWGSPQMQTGLGRGSSVRAGLVAALLSMGGIAGCGRTERIDVDAEDDTITMGISSKDFRTVSSEMTQSLIRLPQIQSAPTSPRIAFTEVVNNSDELFSTDDFLYKMRTELIKNAQGKMVFLDRDILRKVMDEKSLKEGGVYSGTDRKLILGADYFLSGRVESIRKARGSESTVYMRFSFRLTDASTSAIVWEDDYEMKKYHKAGTYDR